VAILTSNKSTAGVFYHATCEKASKIITLKPAPRRLIAAQRVMFLPIFAAKKGVDIQS